VLEVTGNDSELLDPSAEGTKVYEQELKVKVVRRSFTDSHAQLVINNCRCANMSRAISPTIERHNCMKMEPVIYRDGWEWYRMIAFNQNDLKKLFAALEKFATVEVISRKASPDRSVRDSFVISTNSLLGALTEKQVMALLSALNQGYYLVPKKVTADEIASRMGVPRTTFEEHLRKAESKVLHALTPYIQMAKS
jgi:predicted DNA binding protein